MKMAHTMLILCRNSEATAMRDNSPAVPASASPHFLWNEIVRWTLEACILRKEGREGAVQELLRERLPALIRAWAGRCGKPAETCRERLRDLFARVQESVEEGFIQRRLIVEEVCARLGQPATAGAAPSVRAPALGLRRRISIDDIPGMLDALAEAEFESLGEAVLPIRSAMAAPRAAFVEPAPRAAPPPDPSQQRSTATAIVSVPT